MMQIDLFHSSFHTTPVRTFALSEALDAIRSGACRRKIERLITIHAQGDTEAYRKAKAHLPAFTFAGTFHPSRAIKHLIQHSGIVHGDLDHLADVAATKQALCQDPHVLYCFLSPSREGLKLGVRIEPVADDTRYKHVWTVIAAAHLDRYGVTWDPSGKDVSRLCYVSWDPDCYVNLQAQVYAVPPPMVTPPKPGCSRPFTRYPNTHRERYAQQAIDRAVRMIQGAPRGEQHYARLRAARLLGGYIQGGLMTYDEAIAVLRAPTEAQAANVKAAMKTIQDGLEYGKDAPITLEELQAEREAYRAQSYYRRAQPGPSVFARTTPQEGSAWLR